MRGRSDLAARILAAVPAVAFAVIIVSYGGELFAAGLLLLGWVMLHELFAMFAMARPVKLAGFLGLTGMVAAALYGGERQVLLAMVAVVPVMFWLSVLMPRRGRPTAGMAVTLFALWWIGLALAHTMLLRETPHGGGILIDILAGTFIGDTGAYLGGRMFGRRRLAPSISPNKTVEGLLIGMVFAVGGVWFAGLYQDWLPGVDSLLLGIGVALSAPVGDLFESYVKRDAGTKDTGRAFGAHGGALDRLDAAIFSIVTGYYIWLALM